jgi:pimeloyl-ACP methyl ester carboxylesterase
MLMWSATITRKIHQLRATYIKDTQFDGMTNMRINNVDLHVVDSGDGATAVVFSHGLLFSGSMFDPQVSALNRRYRCVVYDHRGQGRSEVAVSGYDMDTLTDDAAGLIEALGIGPCHFVGLSMGGIVGLNLAIRRPQLLRSLTLIGSSADAEPKENRKKYQMLNFFARWFGLKSVVSRVMPIVFGQTFINDPNRRTERNFWSRQIASGNRTGITRAVAGVVNRASIFADLGSINIPTLIIVGNEDMAAMPEKSERMHQAISGSKLVRVAQSGHSSTLEEPTAVNIAITEFLEAIDS